MNVTRHTFDEIVEYCWNNGIDLGFLTVAEIKEYRENTRAFLDRIIQIIEEDD